MTSGGLNVLVLGDLCLAQGVESFLRDTPTADLWEGIRGCMHSDDVVVANLECSLSECGRPKPLKYACLRAVPDVIRRLDRLDVAVLANNHISDYGDEAAVETMRVLGSAGISHLGYGRTLDEASQPLVLDRNEVKVGFLAYSCLTTNGENYATPRSPGVVPLSLPLIKRSVEKLRPDVDGLFVYLHWGVEQVHYPIPEQMRVARRIIDWGANAVIGSHAHVIQPYESYRSGHIFYGLGNFLFGDISWLYEKADGSVVGGIQQQSLANRESLGAYFSIQSGTDGTSVKLSNVWAFRRGDDFVIRPVDADSLSINLDKLNRRTRIYASLHRRQLKGTADIAVRAVFGDAKINYYYDSEPINHDGFWHFWSALRGRLRAKDKSQR